MTMGTELIEAISGPNQLGYGPGKKGFRYEPVMVAMCLASGVDINRHSPRNHSKHPVKAADNHRLL